MVREKSAVTNHYTFDCPVTQGAARLEDCERRHNTAMQGKHSEVEPKICAVAHQCWMCPVRNAFRVGGPWSKPGSKPHWDSPREGVAKLPSQITGYALRHTLPNENDYRRAGIFEGPIYNDHLMKLQGVAASAAPKPQPKANKPVPKRKTKPKSNLDALDQVETDSMSKAVTEAVAAEKAKPKVAPRPKPKAEKPAAPGKKLSLAERAKLMKERRNA